MLSCENSEDGDVLLGLLPAGVSDGPAGTLLKVVQAVSVRRNQ